MANFPALAPSSRPLTPGAWAGTIVPSLSGGASGVRHSSAEIGRRLSLTFASITEAQFLQLVSHYRGQRSGFDSFAFTTTTIPAAYTPSGHQWLYAGPPRVVDQHADVFDVECDFRSEPRALVRAGGADLGVTATLAQGAAVGLGPTLTATASLSPGAAQAINADPYFASVLVLCGFNGTNGSTAFVDEGPLGLALTAKGGAQISTAQSVFGGSSLSVAGSGSVGLPTNSALVISGDFTLDARCRFNQTKKDMILGSRSGTNYQLARESGTTLGAYNGTVATASFTTSTSTWYALRWARSGSTLYFFADGTLLSSATVSGSFDFSGGDIGQLYGNNVLDGFIDELRLTTVCRSTASYTVDTAPFPRS
jgi:hypothetical protein